MMKSALAVIGSGYGDEGKGLMTDYFAAKYGSDAVVVRYNGGAQAGHTVVTPGGRRHVFSHFGSGTLANAETYLSRFMLVNPILFLKERADLVALRATPVVRVDPRAKVTTPYDMMINQIVEEHRGDARHGSVGLGIGETEERSGCDSYRLTVDDLLWPRTVAATLERIRDEWVPYRLEALGVETISEEWEDRLRSDEILRRFVEDCRAFTGLAQVDKNNYLTNTPLQVIFEGAQGLLLDQDHQFFPHVTRSSTGLKNIVTLCGENDIDAVTATYVTRSYKTRHGAGPFPEYKEGLSFPDDTNVPHPYQGTMRFGLLDDNKLHIDILNDVERARKLVPTVRISYGVSITHMDQWDGEISFMHKGSRYSVDHKTFISFLSTIGNRPPYASTGPTREHVTRY